jgi:superfamily II RNA helicase
MNRHARKLKQLNEEYRKKEIMAKRTVDLTESEAAEMKEAGITDVKVWKELQALRKENRQLKKTADRGGVELKVTEKGCIGIYGIRSRPICLYVEELEKIIALHESGMLPKWIKKNDEKLSRRKNGSDEDEE